MPDNFQIAHVSIHDINNGLCKIRSGLDMNLLAVYVGNSDTSQRNLQHGLKAGIWGFKEHSKPTNFEHNISVGDVIILGTGHTGGGPRTSAGDWAKHTLARVSYGVITKPPYKSVQPEWPEEATLAEQDRYLWRVKFDPTSVKTISDVRLDDRVKVSADLAEQFRKSGAANGRGYILDSSHFPPVHEAIDTPNSNLELSPFQMQTLWARFHKRVPGFTDFPNPGRAFVSKETEYKRSSKYTRDF